MAMCQAATHAAVLAFGITLMQSGVGVRELLKVAPPPHLTMLALLSRILAGSPAVYWEIQSVNAHAETARVQLEDSVRHVSSAAKDEESFGQLVDELRAFLGTTSSQLANIAESIFQNLNK
jgi:prephenate dehydrogenase